MALSASIKVCDPGSMPVSFLADFSDLRAFGNPVLPRRILLSPR